MHHMKGEREYSQKKEREREISVLQMCNADHNGMNENRLKTNTEKKQHQPTRNFDLNYLLHDDLKGATKDGEHRL